METGRVKCIGADRYGDLKKLGTAIYEAWREKQPGGRWVIVGGLRGFWLVGEGAEGGGLVVKVLGNGRDLGVAVGLE